MSTLSEQIQDMKTASQQQTAASQALAQEVAGKMASIDAKVNTSIQKVENSYDQKAASLTIIATDGYKRAIEHASGGRNTVVYDAQGNPNIMVVVPRFNYEDLNLPGLELGEGTATAFMTNGAPRSEILVGKYLASSAPGGCAVIGGVQPITSVSFDVAKSLCTAKGAGWHLLSVHEWAAIALWSLANGTVPRGNTNYGRSHENYRETARRSDNGIPGDTEGTARTDTGKGPETWNHDHGPWGIADLVGNVSEWTDQMKVQDGRIIVTLDNNPDVAEANWTPQAAYFDCTTEAATVPMLNSKVNNRTGDLGDDANRGNTPNVEWRATTKDPSYVPNLLLRRLLIESASSADSAPGRLYMRNHGERFPLRGGLWSSGDSAGLGYLLLYNSRAISSGNLGFRPALLG